MAVLKLADGTPVAIRGPKGVKGDKGPRGIKGLPGDKGSNGLNSVGAQGSPGAPIGVTFRVGEISITPVANTPTSGRITYNGFTGVPIVFSTPVSSVPGTVLAQGVQAGPTLTEAWAVVYRTNTTATTMMWVAAGTGTPTTQ